MEVSRTWHRIFLFSCLLVGLITLLPRLSGLRIMDDAYMFVRYADHLLEFGDLRWNPGGDPVYGATSVLYVFALLPFRLLLPDQPSLSLWLSSFFWMTLFVVLSWNMLRRLTNDPACLPALQRFWALCLAVSMWGMFTHFGTGMETGMVMCWLTVYWSLWLRRLPAWQIGIWGGLAFWVRPDMLVFTFMVPLAVFVWENRRRGLQAAIASALVTVLLVGISAIWIGAWLPNSFIAKSLGLYGGAFAELYRPVAFQELLRFVLRHSPILLVLGWFVVQGRKKAWEEFQPFERGVAAGVLFLLLYYSFFVLQVMGYGQRFYYPLLPGLLLLGGRGWLGLRIGTPKRIWLAGMGIVLLCGLWYGVRSAREYPSSMPGVWDVEEIWREAAYDYWPELVGLKLFPDDLVVATSEVGLPAVMLPDNRLIDLVGLNEPYFLEHGCGPGQMLDLARPDLVYLPHPAYEELLADFLQDPVFMAAYDTFPGIAPLQVALLKNSPHYADLKGLITGFVE